MVGFTYRDQWVKFDHSDQFVSSNPVTALLTYDMPLDNVIHGIGAVLMYDEIGFYKTAQIGLSINHKVEFSDKANLRFGPQISIINKTLDMTYSDMADTNNTTMFRIIASDYSPDIDFGLWFQLSDFYTGFSVKHLINPHFDLGQFGYEYRPHLYGTAGYKFNLSEDLQVIPSFIIRSKIFERKNYLLDINCNYIYLESFIFGATYRSAMFEGIVNQENTFLFSNIIVIQAGVELFEKIHIILT